MAQRTFEVWRGNAEGGRFVEYAAEVDTGMVVLDALLRIQTRVATDMAVRWNCKAGKCGSCSVEVNGIPKLSCMTRISDYPDGATITVQPLKSFPIVKDLVSDVSWNYEQNKRIAPFKPRERDSDGEYRMSQEDVDRIQEFRKCIECYLCQDVCHILRNHGRHDAFAGPRFMIRLAGLEMHPLDTEDRVPEIAKDYGVGMCNITRCCADVCPEKIAITENGIIPLKERVIDRYYDPLARLFGKRKRKK